MELLLSEIFLSVVTISLLTYNVFQVRELRSSLNFLRQSVERKFEEEKFDHELNLNSRLGTLQRMKFSPLRVVQTRNQK